MKKYPIFHIALCIAFLVIALPQCKKQTIPPTRLNITLYDKPLDTIKSYISGKWKLEYTYGGFIANLRTDFHDKDYIWQIDSGVNIKQTYLGNLVTDTSIEWFLNDPRGGIGQEVYYVMKFYDKRQYPYVYIVWKMVDDSLLLKDYAADAATYHFSKQK